MACNSFLHWLLRVEYRVVCHCPLLCKREAPQFGGLLKGFLELKGHVLGAEKGEGGRGGGGGGGGGESFKCQLGCMSAMIGRSNVLWATTTKTTIYQIKLPILGR
jgi:hypothetical protein